MKYRLLSVILLSISITLLWYGLTEPILTIILSTPEFPIVGKIEILNETRSVLSTIEKLHQDKQNFVAFLIVLFSIVVPLVKLFGATAIVFFPKIGSHRFTSFLKYINKWAMADVFAMAIVLVFFSTNTEQTTRSGLENGFYYFSAYVIFSILTSQFLLKQRASQK